MPQQTNNTLTEQLPKLRKLLSDMKVVAETTDDLEWVINLETMVVAKEREPMDQAMSNMQQQGLTNAPQLPPGSMDPGAMGGGLPSGIGPGMGAPAGPGMGGMRVPPPQPAPDEIRRLVSAPPQ